MFKYLFGRKSGNPPPLFQTPNYNTAMRNPIKRDMALIGAIMVLTPVALLWFGSPALRVSYTWNGRENAPRYYECTYLNLMSGFEQIKHSRIGGRCPIVTFFNVELSDLLPDFLL